MEIKEILNKIYDFCQVREERQYVLEYSNRFNFIINLLNDLNIKYYIKNDIYEKFGEGEALHNIYLPGTSEKIIVAHHDIVNYESDNANDNSASIINAIALKVLRPDISVAFTDGEEEFCGEGASNMLNLTRINNPELLKTWGFLKKIKYFINLELTGYGTEIVSSQYGLIESKNELYNLLKENNDINFMNVPKSDSYRIRRYWKDSEVISLAPKINGVVNIDHFKNCHSIKDSVDKINIDDMYNFVTKFLNKI